LLQQHLKGALLLCIGRQIEGALDVHGSCPRTYAITGISKAMILLRLMTL
jgi:hypothetical protein